MTRQGELDSWSGQRAAFPYNNQSGHKADIYLSEVRKQALQSAIDEAGEFLSPTARHTFDDPSEAMDELLNYGSPAACEETRIEKPDFQPHTEQAEILNTVTQSLFPTQKKPIVPDFSDSYELFLAVEASYKTLPSVHPPECNSLASWKLYASKFQPVPLNHLDIFRVLKYLQKWNFSHPNYYLWAWALLLRAPLVLTGDEISILRSVSREITSGNSPIGTAFVEVVALGFGQSDLMSLLR